MSADSYTGHCFGVMTSSSMNGYTVPLEYILATLRESLSLHFSPLLGLHMLRTWPATDSTLIRPAKESIWAQLRGQFTSRTIRVRESANPAGVDLGRTCCNYNHMLFAVHIVHPLHPTNLSAGRTTEPGSFRKDSVPRMHSNSKSFDPSQSSKLQGFLRTLVSSSQPS